ncbi:MAG TPA: glucosidase [Candidatus Binatia bacterium]|nr:glucosidase [Candidatus Binatia bacterium]
MLGDEEKKRLEAARTGEKPWKKWGPYLSERQWGTVREDYSENGDAWNYFTHDHARSRAYRWGEDGLAGISDDKQRLCFALALWNGKDPIVKERLFGLTNSEGNHGEDVKEYYFYLDNTPTHAYMKCLYKYPQPAYPYADLVETNRRRTRNEFEYELLDSGVFNEDRYFDVFVEYAKEAPEDILIKITVCNRGPEAAELHVLPTLWFRNTWASWEARPGAKPVLKRIEGPPDTAGIAATHPTLGAYRLYCDRDVPLLFTENDTNNARLFPNFPNASPWVKDGINNYIVHNQLSAVNPDQTGTKVAAHYRLTVGPRQSMTVRLRLTQQVPTTQGAKTAADSFPFAQAFDETLAARLQEADAFYASITPPSATEDEARIMRQALAGMLWSKQYYYLDLDDWLSEHHANIFRGGRKLIRNRGWFHMVNDSVISMPDKWEYPWYAAWDLAVHTIVLDMVDHDFAREQLDLMLSDLYLHPSGQIPAYEWNFSDVNPPVHAFAVLFNYVQDEQLESTDVDSLREMFRRLLLNFTWWVNRKDPDGNNVFEGGFLGMDNIGVFDRSAPLPTGGTLEQADGSAWMCFFSQNMLEIALELAKYDPSYQDIAAKFVEHFLWIAAAMDRVGIQEDESWDEEDGFFYDVLRFPDGSVQRIKIRSMVGLLPLCATAVIPPDMTTKFPEFTKRLEDFLDRHRFILANVHPPNVPGAEGRYLLSLCDETKLRRILTRMLDEERFLSPFGIRSLSKWHEQHPYTFDVHGQRHEVKYLPAESDTGMFGGNSNWRGPIWLPVNMLILRGLLQFYLYYGDNFKIECPTGSGCMMNLFEVTMDIGRRLTRIFLKDEKGRRPVYGGAEKFQTDPHWRDYVLFYEYFHGDNGAGLGASHQTGWTGVVAKLIQLLNVLDPQKVLKGGTHPTMTAR